MVYIYIGSFVGFFSSVASMAEIASLLVRFRLSFVRDSNFPVLPHPVASTTGSVSADAKTQRFLSYIAGKSTFHHMY